MIRFFTLHPTASNLLMLLLMFVGLVTLPNIKRETLPEIKAYEMEIKVLYPGATPQEVEQKICRPLEDAFEVISFVEEIRCESRQSLAIAVVAMLEDGDFNQFMDDIQSAVDEIDNFPSETEEPVIREIGRTQDVVTVALTADLKRQELKDLAEVIKRRMLRDPGIPLVEIEGFSERQYQIQVSQENLRQYGLSLQDIASILARQDLDLPAGDIKTKDRDYQIRFSDERRTPHDLEELIIAKGDHGAEIRLGDIATVVDQFEIDEDKIVFNGKPAAFFKIRKNSRDDSLRILEAVEAFIEEERKRLPDEIGFFLTQDFTSIVKDRIQLLVSNAWQGLILVFGVMWLFFGTRYAFWVIMGLPVSFLASAFLLAQFGISINLLSMVALLLALGILMDDAIVISESIGHHIGLGKTPVQAAIEGTHEVARGVLSSFITTLCIFVGLLFLSGNIGQMLKTIPAVLISVITVSLLEAFLILPHHLQHSLNKAKNKPAVKIRQQFARHFNQLHQRFDHWIVWLIRYRYAFMGSVIGLFILSISMFAAGVVKFSAFPDVEGDILQARILMPVGTSLAKTEQTITNITQSLEQVNQGYKQIYGEPVVEAVTVSYGMNIDALEGGAHLATISTDLLTAELRQRTLNQIADEWRNAIGASPEALAVTIKEPMIGPAGRAIYIRLQGEDLQQLSNASHQLQNWLRGYPGVSNVIDDLRPGKPEFSLHLKPGAIALGLDAKNIAAQLRAAYQGVEILETTIKLETYEVVVILADESRDELSDFDNFPVISPQTGQVVPLSTVAEIIATRNFSRINRINAQRAVTIYGDIDAEINNTQAVFKDLQKHYLIGFKTRFPEIKIDFEGEIKEGPLTRNSMRKSMLMGLLGVFILLSLQFRSYIEPLLVMVNIPLAFIGVIWGHIIMGQDVTMPSLLGFVSLAGIVVNDSILLVEFVKRHNREGLAPHDAAAKASHDRFRAVLLTSLTTIAGLTPLLFEQSLQAQILIPLATSIIFGIASSTFLVLFVIPCLYSILEDFRVIGKRHTEAY
ncbi:MAG: efflux RND transporter permease subunit [Methylococcales bacterium]